MRELQLPETVQIHQIEIQNGVATLPTQQTMKQLQQLLDAGMPHDVTTHKDKAVKIAFHNAITFELNYTTAQAEAY